MRAQKAKLYTRDGGFVADLTTPPLHPPADVIQWGSRTFVFREAVLADPPFNDYREAMMWVHVDPPLSSEEATAIARKAFEEAQHGPGH